MDAQRWVLNEVLALHVKERDGECNNSLRTSDMASNRNTLRGIPYLDYDEGLLATEPFDIPKAGLGFLGASLAQ